MEILISLTQILALVMALLIGIFQLLKFAYVTGNPLDLLVGFIVPFGIFFAEDTSIWLIQNKEELASSLNIFVQEYAYIIFIWAVAHILLHRIIFQKKHRNKRGMNYMCDMG